MLNEFISQYGLPLIGTILTAIVGAVGTWIGTVYKKYINDKTKKSVVATCVKAVEQLYTDIHGKDKYDKAVEAVSEMLAEKNITISEFEVKMLIESTCSEFAKSVKEAISEDNAESEEISHG